MPGEIRPPLTVAFCLPCGVIYNRRLDDLPDPLLAGDLARALVAATHPHGPIRTQSVARHYVQTARRMARDLHADGFRGGIAELTPARMVQYWLTCDFHRERHIRAFLVAHAAAGGAIHPGVRAHLAGRRINAIKPSRPNPPYSEAEWRRLAAACSESMSSSHAAHRRAREAAESGGDPGVHGPSFDNLAWIMRRIGPASGATINASLPEGSEPADPERVAAIGRALFPGLSVALAYRIAFAMRSGIVPDGIDGLSVTDITRTGTNTVLLSYVKGRTGAEALNLPADAVRVLDAWLDHSAALRARAGDLSERVWIYALPDGRHHAGRRVFGLRPLSTEQRRDWARAAGLVGDVGDVFALHGGRLRATYQHRRDRSAWTGRTTIDPNHSARVEGDHYLSSHTPAQMDAIEGIIEQAQNDVRRKAQPPVVTSSEDAAEFADAFPRLVQQAGLDAANVAALLGGEQDVFVAACASPTNSPYAPAGTPCPARPWVCLLCPLAAFTPRHLPNLLRLKDYFSRQAEQMTLAQFVAIFGPYAARLDEDILPRFPTAAIQEAARRDPNPLPLHPEEMAL